MTKAVLVVDMVNGFAKKGSNPDMYCENSESIKPNVKGFLEKMLEREVPIIYCNDSHVYSDSELSRNGGPWGDHCMKNSEESKTIEELPSEGVYKINRGENWNLMDFISSKYHPYDDYTPLNDHEVERGKKLFADQKLFLVEKGTYSGFFGTGLSKLLDEKYVDSVYIVGLVTNICVKHTAADAFFKGYKVNIIDDCCADFSEDLHKKAIGEMKANYGAKIMSYKEV